MSETSSEPEVQAAGEGGPIPPPPPPRQPLRRSLTDRYGVGLCGGLGRYFGVDPVIFRVLFVVTSFFGAIGIIAYLAGYALVPEEGAPESGMDRVADALRRRRIPPWLLAVALGGSVLLWSSNFGWWFGWWSTLTLLLVGLLMYFAMRDRPGGTTASPGAVRPTVPLPPPNVGVAAPAPVAPPAPREPSARALRRRAAAPVRWFTWSALIVGWGILALIDRATAVPLKVFAWYGLAVVIAGLVGGLLWRRPAWSLLVLLPPMVAAVALFGASEARFADGTGDKAWRPASPAELDDEYALAFGETTLDLTDPGVAAAFDGRSIRFDHGAGEVVVRLPADVDVNLHADVQAGEIVAAGRHWDGWGVERTLRSQGADGEGGGRLDLDVELAVGVIRLERMAG